jgi:hypothetical protein
MGQGRPSQSRHVVALAGHKGLTDPADPTEQTALTARHAPPGLTRALLSNGVHRVVTIARGHARLTGRLIARPLARNHAPRVARLPGKSRSPCTRLHKTPAWRAKMHAAAPATRPTSSPTAAALRRSHAQPHWPKVARACGYPS